LTSADGTVYEGMFKSGRRNGAGTITYPDDRVVKGVFKNDELVEQE
jgi:hypothetical protein